MLDVVVHPANMANRDGAPPITARLLETFPTIERVWVDMGQGGDLLDWAQQTLGPTLTVVTRPSRWIRVPADQDPPPLPMMTILTRRRVVERIFAWHGQYRRLRKDNEQLPAT